VASSQGDGRGIGTGDIERHRPRESADQMYEERLRHVRVVGEQGAHLRAVATRADDPQTAQRHAGVTSGWLATDPG